MLPTIEESRANWDKLSEGDRQHVQDIERLRADFNNRKLRDSTPLPDISLPAFTLQWDFKINGNDRETIIRQDDTNIFSEPAIYEGANRYMEVADILRNRYGTALQDLIPTTKSELYLYGDQMHAPRLIKDYRLKHFAAYNKSA